MSSKNRFYDLIKSKNKDVITATQTLQFLQELHDVPRDIYLIFGLTNGKLQPNILLVQAVMSVQSDSDLIAIALALRFGANPNLYINSRDLGPIHILGYAYAKLNKTIDYPLLNNVIALLMLSGSNPSNAIYSDGTVKSTDEFAAQQSVTTWLNNQNYILPNITPETLENSDSDQPVVTNESNENYSIFDIPVLQQITMSGFSLEKRSRLGILLNDPKLVNKQFFDVNLSIFSHSNKVLEQFKDQISGDQIINDVPSSYYYFKNSIDYLNYSSYKFLLNNGYMMGYLLTNYLISMMVKYRNQNDSVSYNQLYNMLLLSINYGSVLEKSQLDIITNIDKTSSKKLLDAYEQPKWKKYCQIDKGVKNPNEQYLKNLAYWLGLDPEQDNDNLCGKIRTIAQANPQDYIKAAIKRQQNRIATNLVNPQKYINSDPDEILNKNLCINRNVGTYPYLYNDLDLAYYRDSSGNIWCFTPDMFDDIRKTKRNPISQESLPQEVLNQIENQRNTLKRLGLLNVKPRTISDGISELNRKDRVNVDNDSKRLEAIQKLAKLYCVNTNNTSPSCGTQALQLDLLQTNQMTELLKIWGFNVSVIGFEDINPALQKDSFISIVYQILRSDEVNTQRIFNDIENILRNSAN